MKIKRYEVMLEKVERICVVVEAKDENAAHLIALEQERRGEVDSIWDHAMHVVSVVGA